MARLHRAELRHRDLPIGQHFQQKGLEGLVGAVHLVDQQDARLLAVDGGQQRTLEQVVAGEEIGLAQRLRTGGGRLAEPYGEQLAPVVPLIGRLRQVQPFMALQPHQPTVTGTRHGQRQGGLAHTSVALQQERPLQLTRQPQGGGHRLVGDIAHGVQALAQAGLVHQDFLPNKPANQDLNTVHISDSALSSLTGAAGAGTGLVATWAGTATGEAADDDAMSTAAAGAGTAG